MGEVRIRVPSVGRLFDEWSAEPLESRFLNDESRERFLNAWDQAKDPDRLCLVLPAAEREEGLAETIVTAFRNDMVQTSRDSRDHWIRRSLERRTFDRLAEVPIEVRWE